MDELRCKVSGNLCGTDTIADDAKPDCENCKEFIRQMNETIVAHQPNYEDLKKLAIALESKNHNFSTEGLIELATDTLPYVIALAVGSHGAWEMRSRQVASLRQSLTIANERAEAARRGSIYLRPARR